ncbi:sodium:solute symporter family protein [Janthinobacterium lividum]|uniref:sodium:solute symporter family protein n=1 Tax=Janthinobacterium lividum TaxID=29581 RepID=UPI0008747C34|nr:sodium:solute symporter family protein [Janthinobacterium lividum]MCC7715363.1 cation acetate symporter [Janthinobacterium lividum]OEZ59561.1 cation/acetate symporter ActP [Janthinobacterium lividum]WQE28606.1 sodium:solute symporter family protein [Janthinobacterium lividum]STQ99554.1 Acetate transporter ActP [Janthinobacterium lividum]
MSDQRSFFARLCRYYLLFTAGFAAFLLALSVLEQEGMPRAWIGYLFMLVTITLYATIGVISRTSNVTEYYVAGRRVPAMFNGMATAADWISAASFISLAGGLYLNGFDGLAFIMGWTGGYCLVALLIAPYLRKFSQYTIPDFLAARYGSGTDKRGASVRVVAVAATIIVSFTYVVAQIYAVGLIASRFTGVDFSVGIFLGLASILVCSFLGGMRAITWTQVAQYIIILVAFLIPAMWLSVKHADNPVPQIAYGKVLPQLSAREHVLETDPKENEVRAIFRQRAISYQARIDGLPASWEQGRLTAQRQLDSLRQRNASLFDIRNAERYLIAYPKSPDEARALWQAAQAHNQKRAEPIIPHAQPFPAADREQSDIKRNNFLALVFCMMLGTAALPHILMRSYTTPSVHETRVSVFWTLFFILLIYLTIPALAVLVKYDIYSALVGTQYANLPTWVSYWANVDKLSPLISIVDVNRDGMVQLAEISIDADVLVLATPEIAGLPYVISGLVAAGGLAAALSTADGLLLAISNALSHDIYYKVVDPSASTQKRVTISKLLLLAVAFIAAYAASQKPADILSLVGVAFSLAASTLFPPLVLGVFWKRANYQGALAGMLTGFGVCLYYMLHTSTMLGGNASGQWFHIAPISAGIFGVPAGLAAAVLVSWLTPVPGRRSTGLVEHIRAPE